MLFSSGAYAFLLIIILIIRARISMKMHIPSGLRYDANTLYQPELGLIEDKTDRKNLHI